jgi:hypothetical protein
MNMHSLVSPSSRYRRWPFALLATLACSCGSGGEITNEVETDTRKEAVSCPDGTLPHPEQTACAVVQDRREEMRVRALSQRLPPSLVDLRGTFDGAPRAKGRRSDPPTPSGVGAGTTYKVGQLPVHSTTTLTTHMIVYPNGLGNLPDWLFTTSTNRSEKTVEVVAQYRDSNTHGIGVFDWSCSTASPCSGGQTTPSWMFSHPLGDTPCYFATQLDGGGAPHATMFYTNATDQTGSPWNNKVSFWNFCTSAWDLVYSHAFSGTQKDCSVDNSCGWWGPIIENFFPLDGSVPIEELGFFNTKLVHDGNTSNMPTTETDFTTPGAAFSVCNLTPNKSWGTTDQTCPAACTPESNASFCSRFGKNCGSVTAADNCGVTRTVSSCGTCTSPQTCGGGGTANVCGGGGGGSDAGGGADAGGGTASCATPYAQANCLSYVQGTRVSSGGHNWTCSNGNCANCASFSSCAPGGTGCPWGVVWTDDGACH